MTVYNLVTKLNNDTVICIERKDGKLTFTTPSILKESLLTKDNGLLYQEIDDVYEETVKENSFLYQEIQDVYPKIFDEYPVLVIQI